ncbi:hypothetical protein [Nocardia sp. NPDC005825]|uniref:hypothetical protein n=1 Tax=unclassified Nocardia TaxID=2637762 RepID=UPI0033FEC50E
MRIFRDHDDHDDHDDEQPRKNLSRDDLAEQADEMVDAIADYLTEIADQNPHATPTPHPVPQSAPVQAAAPALTPTETVEPASIPPTKPHARGRIWRAGAAGSFVVVGLAAVAAWGQPAEVGVPIAVYGLGWIAYLSWDGARRPSPSLALAAFTERRAARTLRNTH